MMELKTAVVYFWDVNVQDWHEAGSLPVLRSEPGFDPLLRLFYEGEMRLVP